MLVQQAIINKLSAQFSPLVLQVENESHHHSSGRGSESHFKILLVSASFEGLRPLARHRAIYTCLADELANGVHALALHTYTLNEWETRGESAPDSPTCRGIGQ